MKLEVKDASIGYKKQVLSSNINMASEPGMVTAILGQNGCGKTTFVKSLMKLIPWCGGGAFLDGVDMRNIKVFQNNMCGFDLWHMCLKNRQVCHILC